MKGEKSIHHMLRLYYELYKTLLFTYLLDLVIMAYNREPRDSYFFDQEICKQIALENSTGSQMLLSRKFYKSYL